MSIGAMNLGPRSETMLAIAGIRCIDDLRTLGAVAAFLAVKRVEPRASLNLLWALEGALSGKHWSEIARGESRLRLLMMLDDAQHGTRT